MLPVRSKAALPLSAIERVRAQVGSFAMLEELVRWGYASKPAREVVEVVVQDEYSHDVVLRWEGECYLAFDTT